MWPLSDDVVNRADAGGGGIAGAGEEDGRSKSGEGVRDGKVEEEGVQGGNEVQEIKDGGGGGGGGVDAASGLGEGVGSCGEGDIDETSRPGRAVLGMVVADGAEAEGERGGAEMGGVWDEAVVGD